MPMSNLPRPGGLTAVAFASSLLLAACGGGADVATSSAPVAAGGASAPATTGSASAPVVAATSLGGTVAVGAPMRQGKLRILDAEGNVVASDVTVDETGRYSGVALTGSPPYRLEACGYAGGNYQCQYSVASAGGTANVTPLTTAMVLLASAQQPGDLMTGTAASLTPDAIAAAQTQLRTGLASVMQSAGVASDIDFTTATLDAGSRSGYDGLLDAVGVSTGTDGAAFVQITPRLGDGNLYLQQGATTGTVTATSSAASLNLSTLDALFADMTTAIASAASCSDSTHGLAASIAPNGRMGLMGGHSAHGSAEIAAGLCAMFAGDGDDSSSYWGSTFVSPTLGHCDTSGAAPVCAVSFALQSPNGGVQTITSGIGVVQQGSGWKFYGDLTPIKLDAQARAQRTLTYIDGVAQTQFNRAFQFEVAAETGLACAMVAQRNADGSSVPLAYYKRYPTGDDIERLSLWTTSEAGNGVSLDPAVGFLRSADDTWRGIPDGDEGDALIRNFYRGGRSVTFSLYADAACTTAFTIEGHSSFDVDVDGVPPVWGAMAGLPWPEIDASLVTTLDALTIDSGAAATLAAAWTFPHGPLGVDEVALCGDRGQCGGGGNGRLAEAQIRPGATSTVLRLQNNGPALAAGSAKTLMLSGRTGESVGLESAYTVCSSANTTAPSPGQTGIFCP